MPAQPVGIDPLLKAEAINAATIISLELLLAFVFVNDSVSYERFAGLCLVNADRALDDGTLGPVVGECTIGILEVLLKSTRKRIKLAAGADLGGKAELDIPRRPVANL